MPHSFRPHDSHDRSDQRPQPRTALRATWRSRVRIELTATIGRVYDALMAIVWRVRSLVCVLLAVSTAIGGIAPVRACACGTIAKVPATPTKTNQQAAATPAAKLCCQPGAKKRSCCSPPSAGGTAAKSSCCGDAAPADRTGTSAAASSQPDAPGCHCLKCECDAPDALAPAAPAPGAPDLDEYATVSPVPNVPSSGPPTPAPRAVRAAPVIPPTDLTISLSRLTC